MRKLQRGVWSNRKKSKLSYIHSSKNKIEKVFSSLNNNTSQSELTSIGCSNISIDEDTLSNIPHSVSEHQFKLPKQDQDVNIISDLDIVELSSIDYISIFNWRPADQIWPAKLFSWPAEPIRPIVKYYYLTFVYYLAFSLHDIIY